MFNSKCAEIFCQSFESFVIVCTDCNLKTYAYDKFVLHYQEIHCSLQPSIKIETVNEYVNLEAPKPAEDDSCSVQKLTDPTEIVDTVINESDIKNEIRIEECEMNVKYDDAFSDSDDNIPLQDILKTNPLESPKIACPQCGKEYLNRASLRMHLRRYHPDSKMTRLNVGDVIKTCPDCPGKIYSSAKALYRHRSMKHKKPVEEADSLPCPAKGFLEPAITEYDLKPTQNAHDATANPSLIKNENLQPGDTMLQMVKNEFSESDSDAPLQDASEDNQLGKPEFFCPECDKKYYNRKSLRKHIHRNHPGVELPRLNAASDSTTCPDCPNKTYKSRKALQRHRREAHTHPPVDNYPCPHCEKQFKSRERVTAHMRLVHKISKKPIDSNRYPCTQCDRIFSEKYMLKRHEIRHTGIRSVICSEPDCGLAFFDTKAMHAHRRHVHIGIRRFVCDICGYSTKQASSLRSHIRTHTGEKPFKCDQCDKSFTTSAAVAEHKVIHNAHIRPHVCDVCGKSFARPKALYHHKPLHLGIKKFVCKICGKAYAQQAGLSAHKRQHNLEAQGKFI